MRGGFFYHGVIAAVLLSVAACGGKDKDKGDKNAAANDSTTEATPEATAMADGRTSPIGSGLRMVSP